MSKGILIGIIIIVAIHASLAYFMYTGVEAINIHNTLPVHDYPDNAGTLTSDQINPKATEAYEHFHTMKSLPEAFDSITIQLHAETIEFTDFIRTTIIKRGGTSSINCHVRTDGYKLCKVMAAIQEKMATELRELSNASFEQHQEWISRQPTSNVWKQQPNEDTFTLTNIQVAIPFAKIGTWRARYNIITLAGIAATAIGGIISLFVIPIIWFAAIPEMRDRAKINRKLQTAKQARSNKETTSQIPP